MQRAKQGLEAVPNDWVVERLLDFAAELLTCDGRNEEAVRLAWQRFTRRPSMSAYDWLRRLGGDLERDRALDFVRERRTWPTIGGTNPSGFLVNALMSEKMFDEAWKVVQNESFLIKLDLARASERSHPHEALPVYAAEVERLIGFKRSELYPDACKIVRRMAKLRNADEQAAYLAELRARHKSRRSLMKMLDQM